MKMGLLADPGYYKHLQGASITAHQHSGFMGGFYPKPYSSGTYSPALNHSKQGFSLEYSNVDGDHVAFGPQDDFYRPKKY